MNITPQMALLISLIVDNALKAAFNTVSQMSTDEINAGIAAEEAKKDQNMAELNSH